MTPFRYEKASDASAALALFAGAAGARYLAGGTNLVDLMRQGIERPELLIDVSELSKTIEDGPDGALLIGAGVKNTALAADRRVRERFPLLARAVVAGASGQLRNMASVGGNLLQRTRCEYFYDEAARCNKRQPGSGCDARDGFNRNHAILGASQQCVAVHPSDLCVAFAALDAVVHLLGPEGERTVPFAEFHRLPGDRPEIETAVRPGELITAVEVPANAFAARCRYRKVRDRASYAFALVSVAVALDLGEDRRIREARLALGGVAHKPWRARRAEAVLQGQAADEALFRKAAEAELEGAVALGGNGFKIELARRLIVAGLCGLAEGGAA